MPRPTPIEVVLHPGPLGPATMWRPRNAGAVVQFEGVVRPNEDGRPLIGLDYEQYEPMTRDGLHRLAGEIMVEHGLTAIRVEHSVGHVPNHAVSFRLYVASPHRKASLAGMDSFIDRMKREVPLWKVPVWADGVTHGKADPVGDEVDRG